MQKNKILAGFTLIELLLVIVILGIVISIAVSIINPARIQRRSRESVLIAQASKLCTALYACASVSTGALGCDTLGAGEIEASSPDGNPPSSTYAITVSDTTDAATVTMTATLGAGNGSKSSSSDCIVSCAYNFSTGAPTPIAKQAGCY